MIPLPEEPPEELLPEEEEEVPPEEELEDEVETTSPSLLESEPPPLQAVRTLMLENRSKGIAVLGQDFMAFPLYVIG